MTPIGPNTAFVLTLFGLLAIYFELIWPGYRVARILGPGVLGLGVALAGAYVLWQHSPSAVGLGLVGTAAALFVLDAIVNSYFLAGMAATAALAAGFWQFFDGAPKIAAGLLFPLCLVFGGITILLNHAAKQARRNKRLDL